MNIIYLGAQSFKQGKRGVENVIDFQSNACDFQFVYYLHWDEKITVKKNNHFVSIGIKRPRKCWYWPILLNIILFKLKKRGKKIIHSHNYYFSLLSIFRTDIFTVHDGLYYQEKSRNHTMAFICWIIEYIVYFRCTIVHFISDYTKQQTLFGKQRRNFVVIPNTSHFELYKNNFNLEFKNHKSEISILIVKSVEPRARYDLLIEVAEKLQNENYHFNAAGGGILLEYYKNEIKRKKLTNISMLGYVSDSQLLNLYASCDMVLMISDSDGFGLPIIEGYLFDKQVIASNSCAIPEVIIDTQYLFENNSADIIRSIKQTISKKNYNQFYLYYKNKFSNKIVLEQFNAVYANFF